jgi:hypothetical protein
MAFNSTIQTIHYDLILGIFYDPITGAARQSLSEAYGVAYQQNTLLLITFYNGSVNTPAVFANVASADCSVDDVYNDPNNLALSQDSTAINVAGDWPGGGNANPLLGQFSVRLNGNQANALTKLGNDADLANSLFELRVWDAVNSTGNQILSVRFPFYLSNELNTGAAVAPGPGGNPVLTQQQASATYVPFIGLPGQSFTLVSADGTKAVIVQCGVDGSGNPFLQTTLVNPYSA